MSVIQGAETPLETLLYILKSVYSGKLWYNIKYQIIRDGQKMYKFTQNTDQSIYNKT